MTDLTNWADIRQPMSEAARRAYQDEARISEFRELAYRLRTEARLTQAELAKRMGTTQSAIARMEGGGVKPTLETLEKLACAVGQDLVVGIASHLGENGLIAELVSEGRTAVRKSI